MVDRDHSLKSNKTMVVTTTANISHVRHKISSRISAAIVNTLVSYNNDPYRL